ncbi:MULTISPECIES: lycopene cyclase domain-containing protein [Saccharopolyspora]|uniref:Lycopene cyclase domain-containing protein n=2 Tax=Saccharopolyspora TaxID=1835 RepID=A0A1I6UEK5_9PSEU|nr:MULTISPECIES: lycopene cyclase domain-containing protein [Saccharopolyspora]TWG07614.1 lycopene cyclase domain-containing protein [Saccharopolyspora dendranthemae]SFS99863.1 lycopene cyclase domain-containing protein [Saccharopolyspora flava]
MEPDQLRYLLILAMCVAITAPLEFLGARVYRRPRRAIRSVLPVAAVFLVWDAVAIAAGVWSFDARRVSGVEVLGHLPLEEVLFFAVIPLCALLTFGCVEALLAAFRRTGSSPARKERAS